MFIFWGGRAVSGKAVSSNRPQGLVRRHREKIKIEIGKFDKN